MRSDLKKNEIRPPSFATESRALATPEVTEDMEVMVLRATMLLAVTPGRRSRTMTHTEATVVTAMAIATETEKGNVTVIEIGTMEAARMRVGDTTPTKEAATL